MPFAFRVLGILCAGFGFGTSLVLISQGRPEFVLHAAVCAGAYVVLAVTKP